MIDRAASLQPARAPKQQIPLAPCKGRGRFPAHEEERLCLPTGSVGSILGKATSTTDFWNTVKQTNKQTNTGRIGSRRQLAENARLVSLGCSGGSQWYSGDYLHIIQRWFRGKPILRKIGRFSLCARGNGVNLPHVCKHAFGDQTGPNVQKPMPFGSLPYQGLKNCGLSQQNIFLFFDVFSGPPG